MNTSENQIQTKKAPVIDLNSRYVKSYATRANLEKAMSAAGADCVRHLIVQNDRNRWVCIIVGFHQQFVGSFVQVG